MNRVQRVTVALEQREPVRVPTISCMDVQKYVYEALERPFPKNMYYYFISPFWSRVIDFTSPLLNRIGSFEKDIREFMVNKILADIKMSFDSTWNIYANIFRLRNSRQMYDIWGRLLGPSNSHADIRLENLHWMMEAVEELGRYPLQL